MSFLDNAFIAVPCPRCGYELDVQFVDALLEATVFCSCCKSEMRLVDEEASAHDARRAVEGAVHDLQNQARELGMTITIEL